MTPDVPRPAGKRALLAGPMGACLANYDFGIYGTMSALVLNKVFFPSLSPAAGTLAAYGTFAAGFIAKPLGGLIFGRIGDRFGRRTVVMSALLLMGVATVCIGLLPTYAAIGVTAPVLLTVLRLAQGLAVGGEWGGAATLAVEHAPEHKRGFWGGAVGVGGPIGSILAALTVLPLSAALSDAAFTSWGWRIPFLVSALIVGAGLWIRLGVDESPVFRREVAPAARPSLPGVIRRNGRQMALVFFIAGAAGAGIYLLNTYTLSYAVAHAGISRSTMLTFSTSAQVLAVIAAILLLPRVDRIGLGRLYQVSAGALAVLAWVLFAALDNGNAALIVVALSLGQIAVNGMVISSVPIYVLLFRPADRVTGAGFSFKTSDAILGGTTPLVAGVLVQATGSGWMVAAYVTVLAAAAITACTIGRRLLPRTTTVPAVVPRKVEA
ncbi:MFS transporter [Amycolatopsis deserti]|uniref:MFS transporter n=1 Tax=Amycolatopsis deserti TaxID=185696 RepID=A0ABQ3IR56_9PSEU|nr:MFS transporter [Amycolatopsis deserti]GHE91303.1 MFS transporter [Amycolatopsis deserti]